jgi:Glycoside hydrolase family 2 C-terminal domain 5
LSANPHGSCSAPNCSEIGAGGQDIAIVRVSVVDKEGRVVPISGTLIQFEMGGKGVLIQVGNGDPNRLDPTKTINAGNSMVLRRPYCKLSKKRVSHG